MLKLPVYDMEGKELEKVDLKDKSFNVEFNPALVHQVAVSLQNNKRIYTAHTKTKGEVRGGGKKPWKQKGTGRARAGSNRSPLWVGGGITFGPRNTRNYSTKINKKMGRLVFNMVLGKKSLDKEIKIVEKWNIAKPKTKELANILNKLGVLDKSVLLASSAKSENLKRAGRNLRNVGIKPIASINTLDLLAHKFIVIDKEAVTVLEKRISGENSTKNPKNLKPDPPR